MDLSSLREVCDWNCCSSRLQIATDQATQWSAKNLMWLNSEKTKELAGNFGKSPFTFPGISIHGTDVDRVESTNLLGGVIASDLSWGKHVDATHSKASQRLYCTLTTLAAQVYWDANPEGLRCSDTGLCSITQGIPAQYGTRGSPMNSLEKLERIRRRALTLSIQTSQYRATLAVRTAKVQLPPEREPWQGFLQGNFKA